ncbi:MAG: hypothetical protein AABX83_00850, partial [Nanoarchaeota archaeon]
MVMNKRGIWRVIEATLSVLVITAFILIVLSKKETVYEKESIGSNLRSILNEISKNSTLREAILTDDDVSSQAEETVLQVFKEKINNPALNYNLTICGINSAICGDISKYSIGVDQNIYSEER